MNASSAIRLVHYSNRYKKELNAFALPANQERFTALPGKTLEKSMRGVFPCVILESSRPVGFFLLNQTERVYDYTENPYALLLTAFSINHLDQGKGCAERAMGMLRNFVEKDFPFVNEILLAVNHKNVPAQKLYLKCGFMDTGLRREGRIGEQIVMRLSW